MEKWRWCDFRMTGKRQWKRDETKFNKSPARIHSKITATIVNWLLSVSRYCGYTLRDPRVSSNEKGASGRRLSTPTWQRRRRDGAPREFQCLRNHFPRATNAHLRLTIFHHKNSSKDTCLPFFFFFNSNTNSDFQKLSLLNFQFSIFN